jgi:hypothetical protein
MKLHILRLSSHINVELNAIHMGKKDIESIHKNYNNLFYFHGTQPLKRPTKIC